MDADNESDENINLDWKATKEETESNKKEMEEEVTSCCVSVFILQSFKQKQCFNEDLRDLVHRSGLIMCGSDAEFYIIPINSCVDDLDVMSVDPGKMAFTNDVPLLPEYVRNLDEVIMCLRIEPYSSYPGFVQLQLTGEMKYDWDQKKYNFFKPGIKTIYRPNWDREKYEFFEEDSTSSPTELSKLENHESYYTVQTKGPAKHTRGISDKFFFDQVPSIWCPQWPREASNWPIRPRKYKWPTKDVILEIVRRGCHVVYVQHRDCRGDKDQHRLAFSASEILLLRSWTPVQQLVYHMLRFFAKRELIQKDCPKEKEVLCTYHFKTLMLWACEQESPEWWISTSLIELCCKLLRKLSDWLQKRCCPNYFIPEANLFYEKTDPASHKAVIERVNCFFDSNLLSQWFLREYILPINFKITGCTQNTLSPSEIKELADLIKRERKSVELVLFEEDFVEIQCVHLRHISAMSSTVINGREMNQYANARIRSPDLASQLQSPTRKELIRYESILLFLAAPNAIICGKETCSSNFLLYILRFMSLGFAPDWWFQYHNFPENYESRFEKSLVYFLRAQEWIGNLHGSLSDAEFELRYRMSMEFLRKSVRSEDSSSDAVQCAVVVYAAAICYANSQYQTAYDLCSTLLTDQLPTPTNDMSSVNQEPMNAGCLLFMDDVATIVGFLVLCKHVHETTVINRQFVLDLRISPNVFAQYILLQSMESMSRHSQIYGSVTRAVYFFDGLLLGKVKTKLAGAGYMTKSDLCSRGLCVDRRCNSLSELVEGVNGFSMNEDICVRLFIECSLEKMGCFYQAIFEKFGLQGDTVVSCYRAMYLYKSRKYDEAMNLCEEILHESDTDVDIKKVPMFLNILVYPPFLLYFDEDIQCVVGLQLVSHFLCLLNEESVRLKVDIIALWLQPTKKFRAKLEVFSIMLSRPAFRNQYYITKHFVARYLILRCLIDCKRSVSEILRAVDELKSQLPLEHIIRQFLLRKLQEIL